MVLRPLLQQNQQEWERARAASWVGDSWNTRHTHGEVERWVWIKAIYLCHMHAFPTFLPCLPMPASSLPEVNNLRLSLAMCQGPTSCVLAISLHTEQWLGACGGAGKSQPHERGAFHCLCLLQNPHFLVSVMSGEIKFHLSVAFRQQQRPQHMVLPLIPEHNGPHCHWRIPSTIQLLIFILFFSASFSSSFLQKRSNIYYSPALHYRPPWGPFLPCQKVNNQEWRRVGVPKARLCTLVSFTFRSLVWI